MTHDHNPPSFEKRIMETETRSPEQLLNDRVNYIVSGGMIIIVVLALLSLVGAFGDRSPSHGRSQQEGAGASTVLSSIPWQPYPRRSGPSESIMTVEES